jgi:O-antigen/teichoic acid export membrane protein
MWYLLKVSNSQTVGTFYAVRLITQFIHVGAVMLTAVVAANVTRVWEHEGQEAAVPRLTVLTKASVLALLAAAALLAALRPLALRLFPSTFAPGQSAYDPLVLFFLLVGVVGLVAVRLNLVEKPRLVCLAWLAGAIVNVSASYVLLHPIGGCGVVSEAAGLQSAAWAGVAGATAALAVCLMLAWREGLAIDGASLFLVGAAYVLAAGWILALPIVTLLVASAFATRFIFSPVDRRALSVSLFRRAD